MAKSLILEKFYKSHPYPDKGGINSLFRYYKIGRVEHLRHLFTERKLYHPLPAQFNDPFECKPHFNFPEEAKKVHKIRQHLIKGLREIGHTEKEAVELVSISMKDPKFLQTKIFDAVQKAYAGLRICSFTSREDNLLFWSHYADSHKGFCVDFDATKMPIASAFKVQYENVYPEAIYPIPIDETGYTPALVKSEIWKHEDEYRTIFVPEAEPNLTNDGKSLILRGNEVKNVYLGSNIDEDKKELIIDLIKHGDFNPGIWTTSLDKSTFSLRFVQIG